MLSNNNKEVRKMPLSVTITDLERFWSRVKKSENNDECWEWQGRIKGGYGQFKFGRTVYVTHRVSYFLHYKVDPLQNLCCHTCDNRKCVNPNHIFLGTQNDNYQDAVQKNRATVMQGVRHMSAKLNDKMVMDMIEEYRKGGITQNQLGDKYGIDGKYVDLVLKGKVWKHVEVDRIKTKNPRVVKLTDEKVIDILRDHFINGINYIELCKKYEVSRSVISNIAKGKGWQHVKRVINGVICLHTKNLSTSKLQASQVSDIKKKYSEGSVTYKDLAKIYNVEDESIRRIIKGISWKHIA